MVRLTHIVINDHVTSIQIIECLWSLFLLPAVFNNFSNICFKNKFARHNHDFGESFVAMVTEDKNFKFIVNGHNGCYHFYVMGLLH